MSEQLIMRYLVLVMLSRKKSNYVIRFFESYWRLPFFHFSLRKFGEVEVLHGPNGADVDINAKNSLDNSGSNETLQNALASIVKLSRIFEIFFMFQTFLKFELLCFLSDLGEICYGVTLGKEQHRISLEWLQLCFGLPNRPTKAVW